MKFIENTRESWLFATNNNKVIVYNKGENKHVNWWTNINKTDFKCKYYTFNSI